MKPVKTARLHRMVSDSHVCPFGIKAKDLLERKGFAVEDLHLATREQTDEFKAEHGVKTTPQVFIDGQRIGGYTDLRGHFGMSVPDLNRKTYVPVVAVFALAALSATAVLLAYPVDMWRWLVLFVGFAMVMLAMQKLRDLYTFTNMFVGYDVLARRHVPYAYAYPFLEAFAGLAMIAGGAWVWAGAPVVVFIGAVGAWSVFKAVYIQKRELKCACVGGGQNVPLGAVSLLENVMMLGMGTIMLGARLV